jgi:hypothetical protein
MKLQLDLTQEIDLAGAAVGPRQRPGFMGSVGKGRGHVDRKRCPGRRHGAIVARTAVDQNSADGDRIAAALGRPGRRASPLQKAAAVDVFLALIISPVGLDPLQLDHSQGPARRVVAGIPGDLASASHFYGTIDLNEDQLLAEEFHAGEFHVGIAGILADVQHRLLRHRQLSRSWNDLDCHLNLVDKLPYPVSP